MVVKYETQKTDSTECSHTKLRFTIEQLVNLHIYILCLVGVHILKCLFFTLGDKQKCKQRNKQKPVWLGMENSSTRWNAQPEL